MEGLVDVVEGTVQSVHPYGAFVELRTGVVGLLHITNISREKVENVRSVLSPGEKIKVRLQFSISHPSLHRCCFCFVDVHNADCTARPRNVNHCYNFFVILLFFMCCILSRGRLLHTMLSVRCDIHAHTCLCTVRMQVFVRSRDSARGKITLETKKLERTPGEGQNLNI